MGSRAYSSWSTWQLTDWQICTYLPVLITLAPTYQHFTHLHWLTCIQTTSTHLSASRLDVDVRSREVHSSFNTLAPTYLLSKHFNVSLQLPWRRRPWSGNSNSLFPAQVTFWGYRRYTVVVAPIKLARIASMKYQLISPSRPSSCSYRALSRRVKSVKIFMKI